MRTVAWAPHPGSQCQGQPVGGACSPVDRERAELTFRQKTTFDALTNVGKHVMANIACARSPWYTKDSVF